MKRFIPLALLDLVKNLFSDCFRCVKWDSVCSVYFRIMFGVWCSVLSSILFALYRDGICNSVSLCQGCYIILYADDILLISHSVSTLEHLLHKCETKLNNNDMVINLKSSCMRIGPRFNVLSASASIISLNGVVISWMTETRYLVSAKVFKCLLHYAKCACFPSCRKCYLW